jgi:hypothetical protein
MKILTSLLICLSSFYSSSCTCLGDSSIAKEFEKSNIVVTGKILESKEVKIWSDTAFARYAYTNSNSLLSYEDFKFQSPLFGIILKEYTLLINSVFKGDVPKTIIIRTGLGGGDCGFLFEAGESYLIYAVNESSIDYVQPKLGRSNQELSGIYRTDICTRTGLVKNRQIDLDEISTY